MSFLDRAERKLRWLAIPNITIAIIFLQSLTWLFLQQRPEAILNFVLVRDRVFAGEWWRLFSFVLIPPEVGNALFLFFALYFFYIMGVALENHWGTVRYNIYLLVGYFTAVAAALLAPAGIASSGYIGGSVFLAFAFLFPEFVIYIFFILPVKVKWIALITWIGYFVMFAFGGWLTRALLIASIFNFLLFFWHDILLRMRTGRKHMKAQAERVAAREQPFNTCTVCGVTEKSNPKMEFRYCPLCAGTPCYCIDHIANHTHRP